MDALSRPIIPPAPRVWPKEPSEPVLVYRTLRNLISAWAEPAFEKLFARRTVLGVEGILLNDPEGIRHVLGDRGEHYGRPPAFVRPIRPVAGEGVLLAEGADWKRQRRMLAPAFTPAAIGGLMPHFLAAAEGMLQRLGPRANLAGAFHEAALDAVLRALFSLPANGPNAALAQAVRDYLSGPGRPNFLDGIARSEKDFAVFGGARRRFRTRWFALVDAVVAERRASPPDPPGGGRSDDMLGLLLAARDPETGEGLSDSEIRDQSATMLAAGFETTSRLLFWATYLLALDPFEQDRVRAEVLAHPPRPDMTLDDLAAWPRLRAVLLETLRLYPPVAVLLRQVTADDVVCGEPVKKGALIWISPWTLHRHKAFWDQPTAFMPQRFAGKPNAFLTEPAYLPFSAGPRVCIGAHFAMAEASVVLATLLARHVWSLESDRPVMPVAQVTTVPDHEPWFTLSPLE
jgi:cytochrome P450